MSATELVEHLLAGRRWSAAPPRWQSSFRRAAQRLVQTLLGEEPVTESCLSEASVHRSTRSQVWVAVFTRPTGGQEWRTTGLTSRDQALRVARKWEAEARAERAKLGRTTRKPVWRVRRTQPGFRPPLLTQREVAQLLHMSERAVREIEHRALQKLRRHPLLREIWQKYLVGELDEDQTILSQDEVEALFNLARTPEEQHLVRKVLALIQG
jgi:DNA-directed RNA polymerase sigma subunit (sigma70/sigma32)